MNENNSICAVCKRDLYREYPPKSTFEVFCAMDKKELLRMLTAMLVVCNLFIVSIILSKLLGGIL